jgi:hypothetical protein
VSRVGDWSRAGGRQGLRVLALFGLIGLSGVVIGLAVAWPLRYVDLQVSSAVRLDQTALAGTIDPSDALATVDDLPAGWTAGDPALAPFGLLGSEFCGREVPLPTALSDSRSAVFANATDRTTLISQALRVDRWQSAREYVSAVGDALGTCDEFFRVGFGVREKVLVRDPQGAAPITDYVSAAFLSEDGRSVVEWSIFAVGDVVVALTFAGPTRPPAPFLNGVEESILARLVPSEFAPDGLVPATTAVADDPAASGDDVQTGPSEGDPGAPVDQDPEVPDEDDGSPTTTGRTGDAGD